MITTRYIWRVSASEVAQLIRLKYIILIDEVARRETNLQVRIVINTNAIKYGYAADLADA